MALLPARPTPADVVPWLVATGLVTGLLGLAVVGPLWSAVAVGLGVVAVLLVLLGPERLGVAVLVGAFFTAPFYKGVAPTPESPVTGTDALLLVGFALLLPRLLRGRAHLPLLYLAGVLVVVVTGVVASVLSTDPVLSALSLVLWLAVLLALPVGFALWGPDGRVVELLAAAYVVGHLFSFVAGIAKGNVGQGRWAGLTTHPNYLGQAGVMSLCLLMYLWFRSRRRPGRWSTWWRLAVLAAAAVSVATVLLSGSRAATLVLAVLIVMVPLAERSAVTGFVLAACGALFVVALPVLVDLSGPDSSLARLQGGGGAAESNAERRNGLAYGVDRFWDHPFLGSGMLDLYEIHNNYLEVLVAIGVFGFAGYALVLLALGRPLFGSGEHRRLAYAVFGYLGYGATVPGLYDRSIWAVVALASVAMWTHRARDPRAVGGGVDGADGVGGPRAARPSHRSGPRAATGVARVTPRTVGALSGVPGGTAAPAAEVVPLTGTGRGGRAAATSARVDGEGDHG